MKFPQITTKMSDHYWCEDGSICLISTRTWLMASHPGSSAYTAIVPCRHWANSLIPSAFMLKGLTQQAPGYYLRKGQVEPLVTIWEFWFWNRSHLFLTDKRAHAPGLFVQTVWLCWYLLCCLQSVWYLRGGVPTRPGSQAWPWHWTAHHVVAFLFLGEECSVSPPHGREQAEGSQYTNPPDFTVPFPFPPHCNKSDPWAQLQAEWVLLAHCQTCEMDSETTSQFRALCGSSRHRGPFMGRPLIPSLEACPRLFIRCINGEEALSISRIWVLPSNCIISYK